MFSCLQAALLPGQLPKPPPLNGISPFAPKAVYFSFLSRKDPQATNLSPFSPPGTVISPAESILGSCRGSGLHSPRGAGVTSREILLWLIHPPAHRARGQGHGAAPLPPQQTAPLLSLTTPALPGRCFQAPFLRAPPAFPCQKHSGPQMHIHSHQENYRVSFDSFVASVTSGSLKRDNTGTTA